MRNIYLIFLFFLGSLPLLAQDNPRLAKNGLPLRARTIVIKTTISEDKVFDEVTKIIFQNGFKIGKTIEPIGEIQTLHKKVRGGWWLKVIATVEGNTVKFQGLAAAQRYGGRRLINKRRNKHIFPFEAMNQLALTIPHTSIEYLP